MRILAVSVVAVLATSMLPAQGMRTDPAAVWEHLRGSYDRDGDGAVRADEYPRGEEKFARFDRDGDGVLTAADFERGRRRERARAPEDGGGRRDRDRYLRMVGLELAKLADPDRDGEIPPDAWKSFCAGLADPDGVVERSRLPLGRGGMMGSMVSRMVDVDRDGEVTLSDLDRIRDALDHNGDGTVQRAELGPLPLPGEPAPDFELPFAGDRTRTVRLSSFAGVKPVALIFGSYT